jgi:chemotaxis protein methyltransferase CheR
METSLPDLSYIIDFMKKKSGIIFTEEKSYIILSKLNPLLEKHSIKDVDQLILALKTAHNDFLINEVVDSLTINETSFYRDRYPFEALHKCIIPKFKELNPNNNVIKILCAACSTGQEPYSIKMHFLEHPEYNVTCNITAIDLSSKAIEMAKAGIYNQFEIQRGLPITLLMKYFTQIDKDWEIKDNVKENVNFKNFNLMNDLRTLGRFDLIFCRNVMIYFNEEVRHKLLLNLQSVMNQGSFLILGASEAIGLNDEDLTRMTEFNAIYYKK